MRPQEAEAMVVVVPVRDEAVLLGACLTALAAAVDVARGQGLRCEVRVGLSHAGAREKRGLG